MQLKQTDMMQFGARYVSFYRTWCWACWAWQIIDLAANLGRTIPYRELIPGLVTVHKVHIQLVAEELRFRRLVNLSEASSRALGNCLVCSCQATDHCFDMHLTGIRRDNLC